MGFCTQEEYDEFLRTCPQFERMLVRSGIILVKYWFSVSDEEQETPLPRADRQPRQALEAQPDGPAGTGPVGRLLRGQGRDVRLHRHQGSALVRRRGRRQEGGPAELHQPPPEHGSLRGPCRTRQSSCRRRQERDYQRPPDRQPDLGTRPNDVGQERDGRLWRAAQVHHHGHPGKRQRHPGQAARRRSSTSSTSASATSSAGTSSTTRSWRAQVTRTMSSGHLVGDDLVESVVAAPAVRPRLELRLHRRRVPAQRTPGRVLPRKLRHRRCHQPRHARHGGRSAASWLADSARSAGWTTT